MSVARSTELSATSTQGFEDAVAQGVARAKKTLRNVKSCWVKDQELAIGQNGAPDEYKVSMKVTFVLDD